MMKSGDNPVGLCRQLWAGAQVRGSLTTWSYRVPDGEGGGAGVCSRLLALLGD